LGPNILLNTLFWTTLNLWSCLRARDQVPHPYKTIGKNYSFYILIIKSFKEEAGRQNILNWTVASIHRD
jgi:hypothetical protein